MLQAVFGKSIPDCQVGGKQVHLATLIMQQAINNQFIWTRERSLRLIQRVVDFAHLPKNNSFYRDIVSKLQAVCPCKTLSATSYKQENSKINEVIKELKANGANLKELTLNEVNDELLEVVSMSCSQLESLSIKQINGSAEVTDKGLFALTKLEKITAFTLEGNFLFVSEEGLRKLLSCRRFVDNLTELRLDSLVVTDVIYNIIMAYKKIAYLSLHTYFLTPIISTYYLPASLSGFELEQSTDFAAPLFSDALVAQLANLRLTILKLKGEGNVSEGVLCTTLQNQRNLLTLSLDLGALTPKILDSIPANILNLTLSKLQGILDYKPLFQKQSKLFKLFLHEATQLKDEHLSYLKAPIGVLLLDAPLLRSIPVFMSLRKLVVKNNELLEPDSFEVLKSCAKLDDFSVINCPRFDSSVLESFLNSSLKHQIKKMALVKTGVSDLMALTEFGNLRSIAISKCFSVNASHLCAFLGSTSLQTTVKGLYLDDLALKKVHLMLLCEFGYLVALYVGNPNYLTDTEKEDVVKLPNLLTNNAIVYIWEGEERLHEYEHAYSSVKKGTDPK